MPDDTVKPAASPADPLSLDAEMAELRRAALMFARKLGAHGLAQADAMAEQPEVGSERLLHEGRRMARDLWCRVTKLEERVEQGVRAHPGPTLAALLGVAGFGLLLGLILRHRD